MTQILKQNQGNRVLRANSSGKILKPNYNFGKSYKNEYALEKTGLNLSTIGVIWMFKNKFPAIVTTTYIRFYDSSGNYIELIDYRNYEGTASWFRVLENGLANFGNLAKIGNNNDFQIANVSFDVNTKLVRFISGGNTGSANISIDLGDIVRITMNSQTNGPDNNVGLYVYPRFIDESELSYLYNKSLGNEAFLKDYYSFLNFQKCEIIDSGVRIPDSEGNIDLEILGLPAGTLEEQRDYANANLFENFL